MLPHGFHTNKEGTRDIFIHLIYGESMKMIKQAHTQKEITF